MGNRQTVIKAYGWTLEETLNSLDALLNVEYGACLYRNKKDGRHLVYLSSGTPRYVDIYKKKSGPYIAQLVFT